MIVMYVRDWPKAMAWYRDKLGLQVVYVEEDHHFAVVGLPGAGPVLHLVGDTDRDAGGRSRCVPNLSTDDFDATLTELRNRGVEVLAIQDDQDEGYRLATIADPEGNELNLYTLVSGSSSP